MKDGVLIEAKGSYKNFINKNTGGFHKWFTGKDGLINQANKQLNASEGAQVNWYFSEEATLNAVKTLFKNEGIQGINYYYEPLIK